jgi:hypothetical protein
LGEVKNESENKKGKYKWKTEFQQGNRFLERKSQRIPSNDADKNHHLNSDMIIKRAENKKPKK